MTGAPLARSHRAAGLAGDRGRFIPSWGAKGASCTEGKYRVCAPPLTCLGGTCDGPAAEGQSCKADELCAPGLICDLTMTKATCKPLPGEGEKCVMMKCEQGLACDGTGTGMPVCHAALCQ